LQTRLHFTIITIKVVIKMHQIPNNRTAISEPVIQ